MQLSIFKKIGRWLLAPHPDIVDIQDFRRAQLLSPLLFAVTPLTAIGTFFAFGEGSPSRFMLLSITILMLIAYRFSRTVHFMVGAVLAVGGFFLSTILSIIIKGDFSQLTLATFVGMLIALIFSQIFFSIRGVLLLAFLEVISLFACVLIIPSLEMPGIMAAIGLILPVAALLCVATWYRDLVEKDRLTELENQRKDLIKTNIALDDSVAQVESANRELEQFAYATAHDLKSPLTGIIQLTGWLEEDLRDYDLPDEVRTYLSLLYARSERMQALLNSTMYYVRLGRGESKEATAVVVKEIVADTIRELQPPDTFSIDIDDSLPVLLTDGAKLKLIFFHLLDNAIKYHDRRDGHITIAAEDQGDRVEFAVTDDGPGIAPEFHDKIFQIFKTLQSRDQIESSGIGLALVEKLVVNQGGTIRIISDEGEGSSFRFTWLKQAAPETEQS